MDGSPQDARAQLARIQAITSAASGGSVSAAAPTHTRAEQHVLEAPLAGLYPADGHGTKNASPEARGAASMASRLDGVTTSPPSLSPPSLLHAHTPASTHVLSSAAAAQHEIASALLDAHATAEAQLTKLRALIASNHAGRSRTSSMDAHAHTVAHAGAQAPGSSASTSSAHVPVPLASSTSLPPAPSTTLSSTAEDVADLRRALTRAQRENAALTMQVATLATALDKVHHTKAEAELAARVDIIGQGRTAAAGSALDAPSHTHTHTHAGDAANAGLDREARGAQSVAAAVSGRQDGSAAAQPLRSSTHVSGGRSSSPVHVPAGLRRAGSARTMAQGPPPPPPGIRGPAAVAGATDGGSTGDPPALPARGRADTGSSMDSSELWDVPYTPSEDAGRSRSASWIAPQPAGPPSPPPPPPPFVEPSAPPPKGPSPLTIAPNQRPHDAPTVVSLTKDELRAHMAEAVSRAVNEAVSSAADRMRELVRAVAQRDEQLAALQLLQEASRADLTELRARVARSEQAAGAQDSQLDGARAQCQQLQGEIARLQDELRASRDAERQALQSRDNAVAVARSEERTSHAQQLDRLQSQLDAANTEVERLRHALTDATRTSGVMSARGAETLDDSVDELKKEWAEEREALVMAHHRALDDARNEATTLAYKRATEEFATQVNFALRSLRDSLEAEKQAAVQAAVHQTRDEAEQLMKQWEQATETWRQETMSTCEKALQQARAQVQDARQAVQRLELTVHVREAEIGRLKRILNDAGLPPSPVPHTDQYMSSPSAAESRGAAGHPVSTANDVRPATPPLTPTMTQSVAASTPEAGSASNSHASEPASASSAADAGEATSPPVTRLSFHADGTVGISGAMPEPLSAKAFQSQRNLDAARAFAAAMRDVFMAEAPPTSPMPTGGSPLNHAARPTSPPSTSRSAAQASRGTPVTAAAALRRAQSEATVFTFREPAPGADHVDASTPSSARASLFTASHANDAEPRTSADSTARPSSVDEAAAGVPKRLLEAIMGMSISALRAMLAKAGIPSDDCVEKRELQERLLQAVRKGQTSSVPDSTSESAHSARTEDEQSTSTSAPEASTVPSPQELKNWIPAQAPNGATYYWHRVTRAVRWDKPDVETARKVEARIQGVSEAVKKKQEERLAELAADEETAKREAARRVHLETEIDARVRTWSKGRTIKTLLATLHTVLTSATVPDTVTALSMAAGPDEVKKAYMRAIRIVHPDKASRTSVDAQIEAHKVFTVLSEAYQRYMSIVDPADPKAAASSHFRSQPFTSHTAASYAGGKVSTAARAFSAAAAAKYPPPGMSAARPDVKAAPRPAAAFRA